MTNLLHARDKNTHNNKHQFNPLKIVKKIRL